METNMPPTAAPSPNTGNNQSFLKQMEDFFYTYLHTKAPFHIPPNVREFIVKASPWITLILMLLTIPVVLAALGRTAFLAPFAMMGGYFYSPLFLVSGIISLIALVLQAVAVPGLFHRTLKAWHLFYYSALLHALSQILTGQIIGMIIGLALSLYVLFEIKEYYK